MREFIKNKALSIQETERRAQINEINISIPHSRFSDIFGCYFYVRMNSGDPSAVTRALDDAKYSWLMFWSQLRNDIIRTAESANYPAVVNNYVNNFIEWANSQFSTKQDHNTPRPLVDVLPVVNMAKVNHKAGD
nr:MAG TPA: hypothetical protein [Caudoviricetes sp.]